MCQAACPVKIDTGGLVKELRAATWPGWVQQVAVLQAEGFGLLSSSARVALGAAGLVGRLPGGRSLVARGLDVAHAVVPTLVSGAASGVPLPRPAPPLPVPAPRSSHRSVVYFPSCLTRIVGALPGERLAPSARAMLDVLDRAGYAVRVPEEIESLCCGMAFASKGFFEAARVAARRTAEALWRASDEGRLTVVTDASPCAGTLGESVAGVLREAGREVRMLDFPAFWAREALPGLGDVPRRPGTAILHPTCTLLKEGGLEDLLTVGRTHAERALVPRFAECCGFAGDRGFLVPELTGSATTVEGAEIRRLLEEHPDAGVYSTCRTCEIGLARAVGRPVQSLLHLVHEAVVRA
jgi:D-lactate dehydrogenase